MDDDDSDRSSEATRFEILTRQRNRHNDDDVEQDFSMVNEYDFDEDATDVDQRDVSELQTSPMEIEAYSGLAEVPIQYEMREDELEHLKNQLQGSHQEALAIVIAQAAQIHTGNNKIKLPGIPSTSSEQSPPISSHPINSQEETLTIEKTPVNIREEYQKITSDHKTVTTSRTVKTPIDGYNWRKYGQKPVKSPQGSRSYFKCTYNECDAKKIESCDQYNSVTKIVYKGQHEHDPPKKVFTKKGKNSSQERTSRQCKSSGSVSNGPILVEEIDAPPPKRRVVKKSSSATPVSVLKRPKKPKFVIHAASDVGISADGYRWRKYGQKMVKGNPHPRNYYKCTCAGCPVRKHIEMAVDGSSEIILTYKGIHDHDMPVRAKDQGPPTVLLNAVSSPSKNNNSQSKKGKTNPSNSVSREFKR